MNIQLQPAQLKDKPLISNLLELYLHDMSEHDGSNVGQDGRYGYKYLDSYWEEPTRQALLITAVEQIAGFTLVNDFLPVSTTEAGKAIAEFFVLRKYRHSGVGQQAATFVFGQYPGKWQVAQGE